MNKIIDNCILIALSFIIVFPLQLQIQPVLTLLLGIITAAIGILYSQNYYVRTTLTLSFLFICLFLPQLFFFLPVLCYHMADPDQKKMILYLLPEVIYTIYIYQNNVFTSWQIALLLLLCVLSLIMSFHTQKLEQLEKELIQTRDSSTELTLALREKNKHLMEKQDYEVYLATLKERNRIAREIHDNVGHMLSRSILQIGALGTIHKEEPLHEQLVQVNDTLNQAMNSIRESVHDLHDDSIDLKQAITEALSPLQKEYKVHMDYDMSFNITRNVKYCLISTVKEAVSNILKHSNADTVTLLLREHPGFYQLCMEDNGTVISKSTNINGGIGLENMQERVDALNGTLRIHTEKGFQIFITIPKQTEN